METSTRIEGTTADPFAAAVLQLSTLRDFIRFAVTRFEKGDVFFGHGSASAWDEAVYLCQRTLGLPLDLLVVASANPEDYTNRGRIITPLKDRFGAEIRTHYPATLAEGVAITEQEAWTARTTGYDGNGWSSW